MVFNPIAGHLLLRSATYMQEYYGVLCFVPYFKAMAARCKVNSLRKRAEDDFSSDEAEAARETLTMRQTSFERRTDEVKVKSDFSFKSYKC